MSSNESVGVGVALEKGAKQLGRRMLAVYRATEEQTQKLAESVGATCKPGCAACCNTQVYVSLPEAVAMIEKFVHDPNMVADIVQRCTEQLPHQKLDKTVHFSQGIPCVFLTREKKCGIYNERPVACRNRIVVSPPADCEYSAEPKSIERLNMDKVDTYMMSESARVSHQRQIPILLAPIPVAILWALRLLTEGEAAFTNLLESQEDMGILDIRGWTQHALKMAQDKPAIIMPT